MKVRKNMFCEKCGKQIENDELFCENCGAKVEQETEGTHKELLSNTVEKIKNPANKKLIAIVSAVSVIVVIAIIVLVSLLNRVSAEKYINDEINFYGYNGYATVSVEDVYDYYGLSDALGNANYFDLNNDLLNTLVSSVSGYSLFELISVSFDKYDMLSNGDEVTATIRIDYDLINQFKFDKKLVGKKEYTKTFTVSGLEEAKVIEPFGIIQSVTYDVTNDSSSIIYNEEYLENFEDYSVHYYKDSYSEPKLEVVNKDNNTIMYITYNSDSNAYSSTKQIAVNAYYEETELCPEGLIVAPTKKQYDPLIVDYLRDKDSISKESLTQLKNVADKDIGYYNSKAKFEKAFFGCTDKNDDNFDNAIVFVYSYEDLWSEKTNYIEVKIEDIKINSKNELIDYTDSSDYVYGFYASSGYDSISALEDDLKNSNGWTEITTVTIN